MFIKPLNNNQLDFIEKFSDEKATTIHTTHFSIGDYLVFPESVPIDVQYELSKKNKKFYLVYSNNKVLGKNGKIIITLNTQNGKYTIPLSCSRDELVPKDKPFRDIKHFFPISEENFKSCCNAATLEFEIDEANGIKPETLNGDEFIFSCKLLYQEIFDKECFPETANYLNEKQKDLATIINKQNNNN